VYCLCFGTLWKARTNKIYKQYYLYETILLINVTKIAAIDSEVLWSQNMLHRIWFVILKRSN
jgi:hypothetical protein